MAEKQTTRRTRPRQPPTTPPNYPDHLGFILAEEDALKTYLENTVRLPVSSGTEELVRVWYRYPSAEHASTYPFITLDLIGVEPALDLHTSEYWLYPHCEHAESVPGAIPTERRLYDPGYSPRIDAQQWPGLFFQRRHYLTYRLYYQIGLWTKNAVHDRMLTARMLQKVILPRPSWLWVPADEVWRRMEVLDWSGADIATQEGADKRIFRKNITLSIQTDIAQDELWNLDLEPYIQKMLLRLKETTSDTYVLGQKDTPPEVTTVEPTEWWVVEHERDETPTQPLP
jgi:hypothetical protein